MSRWISAAVLTVLFTMLCLVPGACASTADGLSWNTRVGTIANARSLPDGAHVYLDAEYIAKIEAKQDPAYFAIAEPFSCKDRLVVLTTPSLDLRPCQTVDVEGTITTLSNGTRALVDVTVWGYADRDGNLLYHGPLIKGLLERTPWDHMVDLTVCRTQSGGSATATSGPNTDLTPGPQFYPSIAYVIDTTSTPQGSQVQEAPGPPGGEPPLPGGSLVEFQCKQVTAVGIQEIGGITYNYLDVSDDPPGTGTIRAYYTGSASTTDRVNKIAGQLCYVDSVAVLCVDSGPCYDPQLMQGTCQLAAQGTIAWVKTFPDGTQLPAGLPMKIVSADFTSLGYCYIQEPNRASGIRINPDGYYSWCDPGCKISISEAQVTTVGDERALNVSPYDINLIESGLYIGPLGMNNKTLAGGPFNVLTPGATSGSGLNNVGLLVKTWGVAANIQPTYFYINDGSDSIGVKIDLYQGDYDPPISHNIQAGDYATVTGIATLETVNSQKMRVVKPRYSGDLRLVRVAPHFTNIAANPQQAAVDNLVAITFSSSEVLPTNPTLTVNGHTANYVNSDTWGNYTYRYTVSASDQSGWATITINGTGASGLTGSASATNVLMISAFGFDYAGNRISMVDSRGATYYDYDVLGRLVHVTEPDGKWIAYEYDLNNRRTSMTIHLSDTPLVEHITQYSYNGRNLLWHVTDQLGGVTTFTYKPNGLIDTIAYPNGTRAIHAYNNRSWLIQISNQMSNGTIIAQFDYTYDPTYWGKSGTRTSVIENILKPDGTRINAEVDYEYDNLYRLTREYRSAYGAGDPGVSYDYHYTYDAAGNRTSWQVMGGATMSYGYDAADKMTSPGTFTYDDAGNTLSHALNGITTNYNWDFRNLMTGWSQTSQATLNYLYDGSGKRVRMTPDGGTATDFLLDYKEVAEGLTGNAATSYASPDLISQISGTTRTIYHADGLGSTRAMTDCNTPIPYVTEAAVYDAYGNVVANYGNLPCFGFRGRYRYYADGTGLDYLNTRYYSPAMGRFVSKDTTGYRGGSNPYAYARNNPCNGLDP